MGEKFTAWITKYALTQGITTAVVEDCFDTAFDMVKNNNPNNYITVSYHGTDWWRTRAEAVVQAEKMRQAKIASLRKSLTKFEAMRFE